MQEEENSSNAVTIIKSVKPEVVAKQYSKVKGEILKEAVAHITNGVARTMRVDDAQAMSKLLQAVTDSTEYVLCAGVFHNAGVDRFNIVSEGELAELLGSKPGEVQGGVVEHNGSRVAARLKRGIEQSSWVLIDCDNPPGIPAEWAAMDIQARLELMEPCAPGISTCERIELRSSSNRVLKDGQASKPASHAWVKVSDPSKVALLKAHVGVKMVTEGLCFTFEKKSRLDRAKTVGIEARTVFDLAVWDTGRLVFCSKPILGKGMDGYSIDDAGITIVNQGAGVWDIDWVTQPSRASLNSYREKSGIELKVSADSGSISVVTTGQLTLDTEIEVRGDVQSLGAWLDYMKANGLVKLRCESPFRESQSEAAVIRIHDNGNFLVHDVGNGTTYLIEPEVATFPPPDECPAVQTGDVEQSVSKYLAVNTDGINSLILDKNGRIEATAPALFDVINRMPIFYDAFTDSLLIKTDDGYARFKDSFYSDIRIQLERAGFKRINVNDIRLTVHSVADRPAHTFDSAIEWCNSLKWDGVERCRTLLPDYFGTEMSELAIAFSMYLATSMAARALKAPDRVEMIVTLLGEQGLGKSQSVRALAPFEDAFSEVDLSADNAEWARAIKGKLVVELAELQGLKTRDAEHIKARLSKQFDEWRPVYQEFMTKYQRRCAFIATSNDDEFLTDTTGNRRWLPIYVETKAAPDKIARDRDQIWAEAIHLYRTHGVVWREAELLGKEVHADHFQVNAVIRDKVETWIKAQDSKYGPLEQIVLADMATAMFEDRATDMRLQHEIGRALKSLKWVKRRVNTPKDESGKRGKESLWVRQ